MVGGPIGGLLLFLLALTLLGLIIAFVLVPLFKGIGWMIGGFFNGIGWLIRHVFAFIGGMLTDTVRLVGSLIAWIVLLPLVLLTVVFGRWSAAGHFARSMKRECSVACLCVYRVVLQRPLRFLLLGGLLEGLEQRVNEAMLAAPTADKPSRRTGVFDGYTIVGSLPGGGSGAKLYIAEPDERSGAKARDLPDRVVIKSFALTDGSTLPQIVRESRALEAAKQLGLVLEHGMDEHRFFYVMPYRRGDHLGVITRQVHGESDGGGLSRGQLAVVFGYTEDLLRTLSRYHRGGLWHKDVKPENVIVHDGRAHLVDLGLVTPLRSAMTLTTHGTEYFRDPEMVRMALRGVKVHQVDGAKFDLYAVGAVLYFVVENTFPAHGGLSAFGKRSPEAVRWIIRRAMADYNKRYETADQMLADLEHVASAADPFAVKPAELPSMGGAESPGLESAGGQSQAEEVVAAAGTPRLPTGEAAGSVGAWDAAAAPGGADAGSPSPDPQRPAPFTPGRRPRLRVTNWWTGAYQMQDPGTASGAASLGAQEAFRKDARVFREQARGFREQAGALRQQVRNQTMSARRAAREQVRIARARAREMRRRARAHRHRSTSDHQPPAILAFTMVAVVVVALLFVFNLQRSHRTVEVHLGDDLAAMSVIPAPWPPTPSASSTSESPVVLVLVNDHPAATNPLVQAEVDRIVQEHRGRGWIVVRDDQDAEVAVRKHLPAGTVEPDEPMPPLLRKTLVEYKLGGVLRITSTPGEGEPQERIVVTRIAVPPSAGASPEQPEAPAADEADEADGDDGDDEER